MAIGSVMFGTIIALFSGLAALIFGAGFLPALLIYLSTGITATLLTLGCIIMSELRRDTARSPQSELRRDIARNSLRSQELS